MWLVVLFMYAGVPTPSGHFKTVEACMASAIKQMHANYRVERWECQHDPFVMELGPRPGHTCIVSPTQTSDCVFTKSFHVQ